MAGNGAFLMLFGTFFKTCDTMLRQWVVKSGPVFETCISMLRQWEGKSDDFLCFLQESYLYSEKGCGSNAICISMLREGVVQWDGGCLLYTSDAADE